MRFVDKITKSKYFQKATETEFIKKKMEEVSNTPLLLTVEVQQLRGTLAVNIPPPPTDRIWYVKSARLVWVQKPFLSSCACYNETTSSSGFAFGSCPKMQIEVTRR